MDLLRWKFIHLRKLRSNMKKWNLQSKKALITGGTKGIGKAIATEFLGLGAEVVIVARNKEEVLSLVKEWGSAASRIVADVSKLSDRHLIKEKVNEQTTRR